MCVKMQDMKELTTMKQLIQVITNYLSSMARTFFSVIDCLMIQDTALLRLAEFGQEEISTILHQMWTQSWTAGLSVARNLHASASLTCGSQLWSLKEAAL